MILVAYIISNKFFCFPLASFYEYFALSSLKISSSSTEPYSDEDSSIFFDALTFRLAKVNNKKVISRLVLF